MLTFYIENDTATKNCSAKKLIQANFVVEHARKSLISDHKWPMKLLSKVRVVQTCNESLMSSHSVVFIR